MKKKLRKDSLVWYCESCNKDLTHEEFLEHAKLEHKADLKEGGFQEMIAHIDGRDWFSTTYKVTLKNGTKFIKIITCQRAKNDMMRYV